MKRAVLLLLFLMSIFFCHTGYAEVVNGIACKVGGSIVTINEFNKAFWYERKQAFVFGLALPTKRQVMDRLIDEVIVKTEAEKRGIIVTEEELDKIITNIKVQNKLTDEEFARGLEEEGLTLELLKDGYRKEIMKARLINTLGSEKTTIITEEEMRNFYDEPANKMQFVRPGIVKLSQIVIAVPENVSYKEALEIKNKANMVYELAVSGVSFQELVLSYSSSPEKERSLGVLGSFAREQLLQAFDSDFVDLIFSLEKGDVASPVRVAEGYSIIRIDEKIPDIVRSYEESRETIRSFLFKKKGDEQFISWLAGRKQASNIQFMIDLE